MEDDNQKYRYNHAYIFAHMICFICKSIDAYVRIRLCACVRGDQEMRSAFMIIDPTNSWQVIFYIDKCKLQRWLSNGFGWGILLSLGSHTFTIAAVGSSQRQFLLCLCRKIDSTSDRKDVARPGRYISSIWVRGQHHGHYYPWLADSQELHFSLATFRWHSPAWACCGFNVGLPVGSGNYNEGFPFWRKTSISNNIMENNGDKNLLLDHY